MAGLPGWGGGRNFFPRLGRSWYIETPMNETPTYHEMLVKFDKLSPAERRRALAKLRADSDLAGSRTAKELIEYLARAVRQDEAWSFQGRFRRWRENYGEDLWFGAKLLGIFFIVSVVLGEPVYGVIVAVAAYMIMREN